MRVFAPMAVVSVAGHYGWMSIPGEFAWIASAPAMICLVIACVVEVLGMMIPWVDHMLDMGALPIAGVAGTIMAALEVAASMGAGTNEIPPWALWTFATIAGGGAAVGVHAATATVRAGSTAVSGGCLNPIFSIIETISSFTVVILTLVLPILAVLFAVVAVAGLLLFAWFVKRVMRRRRQAVPAPAVAQAAK